MGLKFFILLLTVSTHLCACTGILLTAKDQSTVNGRTVEFATPLDMTLAFIPKGTSFEGDIPNGKGMAYQAKYDSIGIFCFDNVVLMDGMNEKGLVAAAFYFPGFASYGKVTSKNQKNALSPVEFPNWILTQFSTLEEVKEAVKSVVIAPTILKDWGSAPPPMHYIVYDRSGKSLVIEPLNETLVVRENPIGVITNSPPFDWQLANLNNYINLRAQSAPPIELMGLKLAPYGLGSGMMGVPGDFTPTSRFVRASYYAAAALPTNDSETTVEEVFHVLNQFDIPKGAVREGEKIDYTLLTTVKDPKSLKYYFRSYDDQTIKFIDLNQFRGRAIKKLKIDSKHSYENVSSSLK